MSNKKISQLGLAADVTVNDLFQVVDKEDTSMAASGTNKRITAQTLGNNLPVTATGSTTSRSLKDRFADTVNVKDFGAVGDGVTNDTAAIQAAIAKAESNSGGVVYFPDQYYILTSRIEIPSGVTLRGRGCDEWEPIYPSRPKKWNGTNLIFKGTGTKQVQFDGITSAQHGGGWREDPDNLGSYLKLTSFQNSNASGAAPATNRQFSVAVSNKEGARYIGVADLRIVNWSGVDGRSGHSDRNSTSLGDAWDIGLLLNNSEYAIIDNVQVVGDWREFAHLEVATTIAESRSERNRRVRCKFQGRVGYGVRAPDRWSVSATTSSSATITWSSESYWQSTGSFRGSNNVTYSYTGTNRSGDNLVFTGVTPDPTGIFQIRHASSGFGNTELQDCYVYGLDHVSGNPASFFGLINSSALEASGFPLRGVKFINFKAHTSESVVSRLHDCADFSFVSPQFEGGGFMIASPVAVEATYAIAPAGETRNLVTLSDIGIAAQDLRLFLPRSGLIQGLSVSPAEDLTGDLVITPTRDSQDIVLQTKDDSAGLYVRRSTGVDSVRVTNSGNFVIQNDGQLSFSGGTGYLNVDASQNFQIRNSTTTRIQLFGASGNWGAGADNTQTFGTAGLRWSTFFAGNGAINTSDANEKQDIRSLTDAEKQVAIRLKSQIKAFRFKDAVEKKGDKARIHFGVIAQDVWAAFQAERLDGFSYGVLCHDTWWTDDNGNIVEENQDGATEHRRFGIRYDQLLAFIVGAI